MNRKQKKSLIRIIVSSLIFFCLIILDVLGIVTGLPEQLRFALYLVPYLTVGYDVIVSAFRNIIRGNIFQEHFLMTVATFAAFALGIFGDGEYPEAVAVMLLYQVGELFQSLAVGKSRQSVAQMMELAPEFANVEINGVIEEKGPEEVVPGDVIVVKPGERIPLDGEVIEGSSFIDTSALTGESVPSEVEPGANVVSGCVNGSSMLKIRVTREYEDSTVAKVLDLVENVSSRKARLENFITRFAKYYTPVVTICAVLIAVLLPIFGNAEWSDGIRRACSFLIVSCPCALVISVPLGFFGGIAAASKLGVLIKGSNYLEAAAKVGTMVFDKTGTLTKGTFAVTEVVPAAGFTEQEVLKLAAHGEAHSSHPIALSIKTAYDNEPDLNKLGDFSEASGKGVKLTFDDSRLLVGNAALLKDHDIDFQEYNGCGTVVYVALGFDYVGHIVVSDVVKADAAEALNKLSSLGVERTVMLTGDRKQAAESIGLQLGVDTVMSELLPADKVEALEGLIKAERSGKTVGYVGDGLNDAPVLMRADVGFAMGSLGSDAAIEAADVVIMDDDIAKIPATISIAKKTLRIVRANVIFALAVKLIILVLSAFGFVSLWASVFGDVGVTLICIFNSMRMLLKTHNYNIEG